MAELFRLPFVQALDSDANPIAGATLTFYRTGTSTLATVYANDGFTTPLANPVTADAAGRFAPIYLAGGEYRAVLKDAGGVTISDVDPVSAVATAAGYSVKQFGAIGDGIANDTAAIQAAVNSGLPLEFGGPQFTYKITATITYTGKVTLYGRGCTIKSDVICFNITNGDGSRISGFNFMPVTTPFTLLRNTTTWTAVAGDVVQSLEGYQPSSQDTDIWASLSAGIRNQTINKTINPGIIFDASPQIGARKNVVISDITGFCALVQLNGYQNSIIESCNFGGGPREAIVFYNGSAYARGLGNIIRNNRIKYATQCGILWWGQDNLVVMGNDSRLNGESGFKSYQYDGSNSIDVVSTGDLVIGNHTQDNYYDGFDLTAWYAVADPGVKTAKNVVGNNSFNSRATGFTLNGDLDTFSGNTADSNGSHGISFLSKRGTITGNTARNNGGLPVTWGAVFDFFIQGDGILSTGNNVTNAAALSVWNYLHTARLGGSPTTNDEGLDFGNRCSGGPTRINVSPNIPTVRANTAVKSVFGPTYTVNNVDTRLRFLTSGNCVVTLPAPASNVGRQLELCTLNAWAITSASANVGPMANAISNNNLLFATVGKWCVIVSDGTTWQIMSQN